MTQTTSGCWSRCNCLSALPTSRSIFNPVPVPALRSTSVSARRAVEGAHAAHHARFGRERAQLARLVVPIRMLDKLAPQLRAQVRPHLPAEAGAQGAHERAPALRGSAAPRGARAWARWPRRCMGAVFEGARRGGGGVDEAVGKAWV